MENIKQLAVRAIQSADYEKARDLLGTVESLQNNTDPDIAFIVGVSYYLQRSDENTEKMLRQCLQLNPSHIGAAEKLINLMGGTGRYDKTLALCEKFPNSLSQNSVAFFAISSLLLSGRLGKLEGLWEGIKQNMSSTYVLTEVGFIFYLLKDMKASKHCFTSSAPGFDDPVIAIKAMYFFQKTIVSQRFTESLVELKTFFGSSVNDAWLMYQASREKDIRNVLSDYQKEAPTFDIELPAFKYLAVPMANSIMADAGTATDFKTPQPSKTRLLDGLNNMMAIVGNMLAEGQFDIQLDNIEAVRDAYAKDRSDPVLVLSSGRCGTTALYEILKDVDEASPFHSYQWQIKHGDRNHVLYRLLENKCESASLREIILEFVKARTAEIIYAYMQGKTPVFAGHWDTILTPVWAVLFPNSKFIYMHRDAKSVFKSIVSKNQWNNAQLQSLKYDPGFPEDKFCFAFNDDQSLTQEVCWYLNITKQFSLAFGETLPEERFLNLSANELFVGNSEAYQQLVGFLDFDSLSEFKLRGHYERPVNTKDHRKVVDDEILESELEKVDKILADLERLGCFD